MPRAVHADPTPARRRGAALSRVLVIVVATLAILINQSASHWRDNLADDHLFAFFGWRVASGATPYLDVWDNKPPGIWWINAAAFLVCGEGPWGPVVASTTALALSLAAFSGAAAALFHPSVRGLALVVGALVLTHLRYECGGNRTETWVVALETLAVCGYLRWRCSRRHAWLVVAALAAGAAPVFKQAGIAAAAACLLHGLCGWWLRRHHHARRAGPGPPVEPTPCGPRAAWVTAALAALAPSATAAGVLAAQSALSEAHFAVGAFNHAYFAVHDARWLPNEMVWRVVRPALLPMVPLLALAGAGVLIATIGSIRDRAARRRQSSLAPADAGQPAGAAAHSSSAAALGVPGAPALLVAWVLLAFYFALVGPGRREYHLMPMLPGLALLALLPLHTLAGARGLRQQLALRPTHCAAFVAYALVLVGFVAPGAAATLAAWRHKRAPWSTAWAVPPPHELQAAYIRAHGLPTDRLYVWGWSPSTYRAAYRANASRFATLEKRSHVGEHAQFILDGAIADLRAHPPRWILITPSDLRGLSESPERSFAEWLASAYAERAVVGGMTVLERGSDGSRRSGKLGDRPAAGAASRSAGRQGGAIAAAARSWESRAPARTGTIRGAHAGSHSSGPTSDRAGIRSAP